MMKYISSLLWKRNEGCLIQLRYLCLCLNGLLKYYSSESSVSLFIQNTLFFKRVISAIDWLLNTLLCIHYLIKSFIFCILFISIFCNLSIPDAVNFISNKFFKSVAHREIPETNAKYSRARAHWMIRQFDLSPVREPTIIHGFSVRMYAKAIDLFDLRASEYCWESKNLLSDINSHLPVMTKNDFLYSFGHSNNFGSYCWSGSDVPLLSQYNLNGLILFIDVNNDIVIDYCPKHDLFADDRNNLFQLSARTRIAVWKASKIYSHIESKYNLSGFSLCNCTNNQFDKIYFGRTISYQDFMFHFRNGNIMFLPFMNEKDQRLHQAFRANIALFDSLIYEARTSDRIYVYPTTTSVMIVN